jgi:hypothetical protein
VKRGYASSMPCASRFMATLACRGKPGAGGACHDTACRLGSSCELRATRAQHAPGRVASQQRWAAHLGCGRGKDRKPGAGAEEHLAQHHTCPARTGHGLRGALATPHGPAQASSRPGRSPACRTTCRAHVASTAHNQVAIHTAPEVQCDAPPQRTSVTEKMRI